MGPGDKTSAGAERREDRQTGAPGADWPMYTADERAVLVFDRRTRVEIDPHSARRDAWTAFTN